MGPLCGQKIRELWSLRIPGLNSPTQKTKDHGLTAGEDRMILASVVHETVCDGRTHRRTDKFSMANIQR